MAKVDGMDFSIIGVGASAGGLEALENFFKNKRPSSKFAFVVIQHLSPDYKSMMAELLSKHTEIPIQQATHNIQVRPGNAYLIPPKQNITLKDGNLILEEIKHKPGNLNLPIDNFLISLSEEEGDKAIGIILSGTGSDGTRGIRKIKENGGLVIVQEELEAKFDGMPRSAIATGMVDYILPVEKMIQAIEKFVDHPLSIQDVEPTVLGDEDNYGIIISAIKKSSGVDFSNYKSATVTRRIARRMSLNQVESLKAYTDYIEENPREVEILQKELLIGVTNFFRDSEAFGIIENEVLPKIFSSKQKRDQIRIWVTACSTGEEAYSIAILVKEYMKRHNLYYDVKIFATDVDPFALKTAGIGTYTDSIAADVSEERLKNFFIKKSNIYKISPDIREMVIFAPQNLIKDPPFSRIDFISCRNLLIYLQQEVQQKILNIFHFSLIQGGYLFLGSSESLGELSGNFSEVNPKWKIFQAKPGSLAYSVGSNTSGQELSYKNIYSSTISSRTSKNEKILDKLFSSILEKYLPPCAIVNESFQILHVIGDINPYIRMQSGKVNFDITVMADRNLKIALSTGLRKCFFDNKEVVYKNISVLEEYYKKNINLIIQPVRSDKLEPNLAVVIFEEAKSNFFSHQAEKDSGDYKPDELTHQRIVELEQELEFNRENLQATIEQLETSNEELQATNEELLAANEELQSTNEELQSVNEELVTLNSEHQGKIQELTELNDDINNLLSNTDIGVIFLDEAMNIRKFTPAAQRIINLMPTDKGRPISHISHKFKEQISLFEESKKVLANLTPKEAELTSSKDDREDLYYLVRFLPYRTTENRVQGVVISFIDITELKNAESIIKERLSFKSNILETIRESIITTDSDFVIKSWNLYSESLFGYTEEEAIGKDYFTLVHPNYSSETIDNTKQVVLSSGHIARNSEFIHKNGKPVRFFTVKDLVQSIDGEEENIIIICRQN